MRWRARLPGLLAALALALLPNLVLPRSAWACSCAGISTSRALRQADAVFRGTVTASATVGRGAEARRDLRFAVDRVYKGTVYRDQVVATGESSAGCGLDPQPASTWTIFAVEQVQGRGDSAVLRLVTNLCSGNLPGGGVPIVLGAGYTPRDGASDREERATRTDRRITRGLLAAVVGGLVLLSLGGAAVGFAWRAGRHDPSVPEQNRAGQRRREQDRADHNGAGPA